MVKSFISLEMNYGFQLPQEFKNDDVRFSKSFVEFFLNEFTNIGDIVLDPFAGYGTTLFVSELLSRIPFGVELDKTKVNFVKTIINHKENIFLGDSRSIEIFDIPKIDFVITSPPYMSTNDREYALSSYQDIGTYQGYLKELGKIFSKIKDILKPNKHLIIEVSNLKNSKITPLAWDIAKEISKIFTFQGEIILCWSNSTKKTDGNYGYGYDHSYALVFLNN